MYKKSLYNLNVEKLNDGKELMYNTYSGSFAIFDQNTRFVYENIDKLSVNYKFGDNNIIDNLYNLGFIILKDRNESDELRLKARLSRFSRNSISITIAPTLDCNMACPYCFESKKKIVMSQETEEQIIKFLEKIYDSQRFKFLHITWYGGEPLLEVESIYRLSDEMIKFCDKNRIKYFASIITNGVLLTYDVAEILKIRCRVSFIQVTIDGLPEYHNKKRKLVDGRDSFPIIIENVDKCKKMFKISIRVNIDDHNKNNVNKLYDYLVNEKKWGDNPSIYYAPIRVYDNNKKITKCISTCEYIDKEVELLEKYIKRNPKLIDSFYPKVRVSGCGSISKGSYVIDPLGDLYPCYNVIGDKKENIGNISEFEEYNKNIVKWFINEADERCNTCKLFPICGGGCPHEKIRFNKSICDTTILATKKKLKVIYNTYKNQ